MVELLVGFSIILLTYSILVIRYDYLKYLITVVLLSRLLVTLINNNFYYILDAAQDGLNFYKTMLNPELSGTTELLMSDVYFYSKIFSYLFKFFEPSIFLVQSFSISLTLITTVLFYKLINFYSDNRNISLIITAIFLFFPAYINYSILTMREVYIIFFIILMTYSFVQIYYKGSVNYIFPYILCFFGIFVLHGGALIGYFFLSFLIGIKLFKQFLIKIKMKKVDIGVVVIFSLFIFLIVKNILLDSDISIPYLRDVQVESIFSIDMTDINTKINYISNRSPKSSFPRFLIADNNVEFFLLLIPRFIYFQFSPLLMSLPEPKYAVVLIFDSVVYLFIFYLIIRNHKIIFKDKKYILILILFLILSFTYMIGTFNIGQAVRHRIKFLVFLLILLVPIFKEFRKK